MRKQFTRVEKVCIGNLVFIRVHRLPLPHRLAAKKPIANADDSQIEDLLTQTPAPASTHPR